MASGLSASDGYYIIPAVRPGHYRARISPEQLGKLELASTAPVQLTMRADGEFVYGLDFRLQSKLVADAAGPAKAATDEEFVVESLTSCRRGSDCNALQANIRRLGYEPTLIPVTTMHLQRLRLGPFAGKKIRQAPSLARTIEPGSYSVRVGDSYVIHAAAYLMPEYIDKQVSRFAAQGMKVHLEQVTVAGTLHRVRFGMGGGSGAAVAPPSMTAFWWSIARSKSVWSQLFDRGRGHC